MFDRTEMMITVKHRPHSMSGTYEVPLIFFEIIRPDPRDEM